MPKASTLAFRRYRFSVGTGPNHWVGIVDSCAPPRNMERNHLGATYGLAFLLFVWGCPTVRTGNEFRSEQINVQGSFHHEASGITFPETVGNYIRDRIIHYDGNYLDVSAGYNLTHPHVVLATVYVYPIPGVVSVLSPPNVANTARMMAAKNEFARSRGEILQSHAVAKLTEEAEALLTLGNKTHHGWKATFELHGARFGQKDNVASYLYVFPYVSGNWTLKYRFTHSKATDGIEHIEAFMRDLKLTFKEGFSLQLPGVFETTR
jgi:hypothetical protein